MSCPQVRAVALSLSRALAAVCLPAMLAGADLEPAAAEILQRRCITCHGPKLKSANLDLSTRAGALRGGIKGPALQPASAAGSLMLARIDAGQMPPAAPLPASEREVIRQWIDAGAPWSSAIQEKRAGPDWWSLQPLKRSPAPEAGGKSVIDRWIQTRLQQAGLKPTPPATRRALIRRLSFDLLGLPPDPAEVEAFVRDPDPRAWERLVDRTLASTHYGERWARHWLDVVRYSESEGFERDSLRDNVWRYRDFVIRAFNEDKPYARFAAEQIAGDVMPGATRDSVTAAGFLTLGPTDAVGLTSAVEAEREAVREDMLEEMLGTVAQTFLGLTVNCARCHDHKFDPIPQRDYYRFRSVFASVWPAIGRDESLIDVQPNSMPLLTPPEKAERQQTIASMRGRIAELESEIAALYRSARPASARPGARVFARWTFDTDGRDESGEVHARIPAKALLVDGGVEAAPGSETVVITTTPLKTEVREKTLEAWIRVNQLPTKAFTLFELRNQSGYRGASVDGMQFSAGQSRHWENFSIGRFRSENPGGGAEDTAPGRLLHLAIAYTKDGRIHQYRNGQAYGRPYLPEQGTPLAKLQTYFQGDAIARFTVTPGMRIEEARIHASALTPAQIAASFAAGIVNHTGTELRARMSSGDQARLGKLESELAARQKELAGLPTPEPAWIPSIRPAPASRILQRGDVNRKGDVVAPGGVSCVKGAAEIDLAADAPDAAKRLKLAEWLTADSNPLFWRVIVNRVWQHHFGAGIAENANDLGYNGGQPSHPELLDELAIEFRASGGSLKALHRIILLSDAYQRSSRFDPAAAAKDSGNRLLWRFSPRRLDAETARDAMLTASGLLNPKMSGPGFRPFDVGNNTGSYKTYTPADSADPEHQRRTIYRMSVTSAGNPMLDALDCPTPSVRSAKRGSTTTALQALSLMNNAFVQRQAQAFAERLKRETADPDEQVRRAFAIAFGRAPAEWELAGSRALISARGLGTLCWGILNTSEFLYAE